MVELLQTSIKMNLTEFKIFVDRAVASAHRFHISTDDINMGIRVYNPNHIGTTPTIDVRGIHHGIDWDIHKCIIYPTVTLIKDKQDTLLGKN